MERRGTLTQPSLPTFKWKQPVYRRAVRRSARRPKAPATPFISIIIPAHNEEDYVKQTLQALHRQVYRSFEIIVVANGCADRTVDMARGRCHRLIVLSQKCLGVARNLGARMARGELVVFLDATILEPDALESIVARFHRDDAAATVKGRPSSLRFGYRLIYFLKNFTHLTHFHTGSSGIIICWKKYFMRAGGFDEGLEVRENSELIRRLRKMGSYRYIRQVTATTSMRRYDQCGCGKTVWLWVKLWLQGLIGRDLHHRRYETVR